MLGPFFLGGSARFIEVFEKDRERKEEHLINGAPDERMPCCSVVRVRVRLVEGTLILQCVRRTARIV